MEADLQTQLAVVALRDESTVIWVAESIVGDLVQRYKMKESVRIGAPGHS